MGRHERSDASVAAGSAAEWLQYHSGQPIQTIRGGAAEAAGLRAGTERTYIGNTPVSIGGDLIVAIDGQDITDTRDLAGAMNNHRAGDKITVTIYRGKKRMDVPVTLGEARQTA